MGNASIEDAQHSSDEIIVTAPAEQSSIDRTIYIVRDTPEAQTLGVLDILARLPLVDVTPSGQVRLRGNSGVTILIDGREVPNPLHFIRSLQGGQIARVEIATNPSAEFSARGTAGVINIITRRSFDERLGGSITGSVGTFGSYEAKGSPTWSLGRNSISGGFSLTRSVVPVEFARDRRIFEVELPEVVRERGRTRNAATDASANVSLTHKLTPKQSLTLTGYIVDVSGRIFTDSTIRTAGFADATYVQSSSGGVQMDGGDLSLDYQMQGPRDEELFTIALKATKAATKLESNYLVDRAPGGRSTFRIRASDSSPTQSIKSDYVRPLGSEQRLTVGASVERTETTQLNEQSGELPLSGETFSLASKVHGSVLEAATYTTYQLRLFGVTAKPGIRMEARRYNLFDVNVRDRPEFFYPFPSFHLERGLSRSVTTRLSYSRRVAWPSVSDLHPALRFSDPTTAKTGNPLLRPELTDSFEAKVEWRPAKHAIEMTLFSRITQHVWSDTSTLADGGVLVTSPVNLGRRTERGISLIASGSIGRGFRYRMSGDLADQHFRVTDHDNFRTKSIAYGGSVRLEHNDGIEGKSGSDRVVLNVNYRGPINGVLYRTAAYMSADATWSHAFTDRLSGVVDVQDLFGSAKLKTTYTSTAGEFMDRTQQIGPRVKLSLTYRLGRVDD